MIGQLHRTGVAGVTRLAHRAPRDPNDCACNRDLVETGQ